MTHLNGDAEHDISSMSLFRISHCIEYVVVDTSLTRETGLVECALIDAHQGAENACRKVARDAKKMCRSASAGLSRPSHRIHNSIMG